MKSGFYTLAAALSLSLLGCGEAMAPGDGDCSPGDTQVCQCDGGLNGTRQCMGESLGYTACDCFGPGPVDGRTGPMPEPDGSQDAEVADSEPQDSGPETHDGAQAQDGDVPDTLVDAVPQLDAEPSDVTPSDASPDGEVQDTQPPGSDVSDADVASDVETDGENDAQDALDPDIGQDSADGDGEGDSVEPPTACVEDADCDDQNPCTDEVCMVSAGVCVYDAVWTDGFDCDGDQNPCTLDDICVAGECVPGSPMDCSELDTVCEVGACVPDGPGSATCAVAPANEGFPCDDASVCTVDDACSAGLCTGSPLVCAEDDQPCTEAACDALTGCTQAMSPDAAPCDDDDICTDQDACHDGACSGDPVACPGDDNSCTLDVCVMEQGGCVHLNQPDGTLCQDGQGCTLQDICVAGQCEPGELKACDSGDPCASDLCDFVTGQCASVAIPGCGSDLEPCDPDSEAPCSEGVCDPTSNGCVPCLVTTDCAAAGLACVAHQCVPAVACDAVTSCALVGAVCDEETGFCMECVSDGDCSDDMACVAGACQATAPVVCSEGACVGLLHFECGPSGTQFIVPDANCDDVETCTDDYCSATQGCIHINNNEPCNDEDLCTDEDACSFGSCVGTAAVVCLDDDPCDGTLTCDAATGACVNSDPLLCDDSDPCNGLESCDPNTGGCLPGAAVDCGDEDLCNGVETCDPESGDCLPGIAVVCDDTVTCNGLETCEAETGLCLPGTPVSCTDGLACNGFETCDPTVDACVPGVPIECSDGDPCNGVEECYGPGFCTAPENIECGDDDLCNGAESCDPESGLCVPGPALICDDSDPCTNDYCTADIGCSNIYIPACDEGLCDEVQCPDPGPCGENICNPSVGECQESETDCDDLDPCTVDTCDEDVAAGQDPCVHTLDPECQPCAEDDDCTDDNPCTIDTCDEAQAICDFSSPTACDDANDCSADGCDPATGCTFEVIKPCPGLACSFDFECSDDSACTVDTCEVAPGAATGDCLHTPIECDDGDPCHAGTCDPSVGVAGGCVFNDLDCDDGNICTLDSCGTGPGGGCDYEDNPCDDGDVCTQDSCDGLTQECEHLPVEGCEP